MSHSDLNVAVIVSIAFASIAFGCSALTIFLIWSLKHRTRNGFLKVLLALSVCQLVYDLSFIVIPFGGWYIFLRSTFGLASAFWTNVISLIILRIVWKHETFNIENWLHPISWTIAIVSTAIGALIYFTRSQTIFLAADQSYYWLRISSIFLNIGMCLLTYFKLHKRKEFLIALEIDYKADPVRVLSQRMIYYPIVQVISRLGASWYELVYGHEYLYSPDLSNLQKISLILYSITAPAAGIGYFVIFIVLSPGASKLLYDWITCYSLDADAASIDSHRNFHATFDNKTFNNGEPVVSSRGKSNDHRCMVSLESEVEKFILETGLTRNSLHNDYKLDYERIDSNESDFFCDNFNTRDSMSLVDSLDYKMKGVEDLERLSEEQLSNEIILFGTHHDIQFEYRRFNISRGPSNRITSHDSE